MNTLEIWKTVENWTGYEVSNQGRVRSTDRTVTYEWKGKICQRHYAGKILRHALTKDGYKQVTLSDHQVLKSFPVHRLVAIAFIPNPENLPCVLHKNDDKLDANSSNLRWGTNAENSKDMTDRKRQNNGSRMHSSILTEEDIPEIRRLLKSGMKQRDIAELFGVKQPTISEIKLGTTWMHVVD